MRALITARHFQLMRSESRRVLYSRLRGITGDRPAVPVPGRLMKQIGGVLPGSAGLFLMEKNREKGIREFRARLPSAPPHYPRAHDALPPPTLSPPPVQ